MIFFLRIMNDTRVRFMIQNSLIDLNLLHISDIVFILEMQLIRKKVEEIWEKKSTEVEG